MKELSGEDDLYKKMEPSKANHAKMFEESKRLENEIIGNFDGLEYE